MEDDDKPVGRVLSRRKALAVFGAAGVTFAAVGTAVAADASTTAATATTAKAVDCVAKPEMTEGPYFVDEGLNRSDIRVDTSDGSTVAGATFTLVLHILQLGTDACKPLPGATVDIWHCDPAGIYSDIAAEGTTGTNFLRGYQVTNRGGIVKFTTVLPGWYQGRTVHTHVKVRTTGTDGNPYEFTSQLYFTKEFKAAPAAPHPRMPRPAPHPRAPPPQPQRPDPNPAPPAPFQRITPRSCRFSGRMRRGEGVIWAVLLSNGPGGLGLVSC